MRNLLLAVMTIQALTSVFSAYVGIVTQDSGSLALAFNALGGLMISWLLFTKRHKLFT